MIVTIVVSGETLHKMVTKGIGRLLEFHNLKALNKSIGGNINIFNC